MIFLLASFGAWASQGGHIDEFDFTPSRDCPEAECVDELISQADHLKEEIFESNCLENVSDFESVDLEAHFENNLVSESCLRLFGKVEENNKKIDLVIAYVESTLDNNDQCHPQIQEMADGEFIEDMAAIEGELQCSEEIRQQHRQECRDDFVCALSATAHTLTGPVGRLMNLDQLGGEDCDMTQDSCLVQLATGFVKSVFLFFEGTWELLKMAGRGIKGGVSNMWDWMRGVEDHSSSAQLAAAEASEDEGIFRQLVDDFPGTMAQAWEGISEALGIWMKENVFCQKWTGLPYHSECLEPAVGFDCLSCQQKINGFCGISGIFVAEIVPAFLTGGLVTAIKHGASGAGKIARGIRISDEAMGQVKNSSLSQYATRNYNEASRAITSSRLARGTRQTLMSARDRLQNVLIRPSTQYFNKATQALHSLATKQGVRLVKSGTDKFFAFSKKALGTSLRAVIYPIDNPLTRRAYTLGNQSLDRVFTLGSPVAIQGGVRSTLGAQKLRQMEEIDHSYLNQSSAEYSEALKLHRRDVASESLERNYRQTVDELYPEISPRTSAENLNLNRNEGVRELQEIIERTGSPRARERLHRQLQADLAQGPRRVQASTSEILENSRLTDEQRIQQALEQLNINPNNLGPNELENLTDGLLNAHNIGAHRGAGVFEYTLSEIRQKRQALLEAGFSGDQADYLIRSGLAGRPPTRTVLERSQTRPSDYFEDLTQSTYDQRQTELLSLYSKKAAPQGVVGRVSNFFSRNSSTKSEFSNQLDAFHFIDYAHSSRQLNQIGLSSRRSLATLRHSETYKKKAFENFKRTRDKLNREQPEISLETLQDIQANMMRGGVENVRPDQLGAIRTGEWYGNVSRKYALPREIVDNINANPYLGFVQDGVTEAGHFYGSIPYPNLRNINSRPEALQRIEASFPDLAQEIRQFGRISDDLAEQRRALSQLENAGDADPEQVRRIQESIESLSAQHTAYVDNMKTYNRRLTEALAKERFEWFQSRRAALGDLDSADKVDDYVDLIAEFQRDLISIHPVNNGNGRSTRMLLLDYGMRKEGLPPVTLLDPDLDMYASLSEWKQAVRNGVIATNRRQQDLAERVRFDLPLENSLELTTPHVSPGIHLNLKKQGSTVTRQTEGIEHIDPRTYRHLLKRKIDEDPGLVDRIEQNPHQTWREIDEDIASQVQQNNLHFHHKKFGAERVELGVVDDDFVHLFGRASYHDPELYRFKMNNWYDETITWRGLASKAQEKSEAEILEMFRETSLHMSSNSVLSRAGRNPTPEKIRELALDDFAKYNDDLFSDGLVRMARDHSETGPLYGQSYGYSTSKNREVGKAFAMGAMVVADYGKHHEFQHLLRSRVLVGAQKARKDVDLTRLKQVREDFSYSYGRQQEVMGIGAADPDAVRIVQTIDENGEAILSYVRHTENPNQILVVDGHAAANELPDMDRVIRTIDLNDL